MQVARYTIHEDKSGEFYWIFTAANGEKIAKSTDGYKGKQHCVESIELIKGSADAPVVDSTVSPMKVIS